MIQLYMLGQSKKRFDSNENHSQNLSVILKRPEKAHTNLILNKEMIPSCKLNENVMPCCEFTVASSGYYHISSQVTVKNTSKTANVIEFLQMGICLKDMSDYKDNLKSQILNSSCNPDYVISDNLCAIIHFTKDEVYNLWLNFGCESASNFEYQSDYSNLRIYKL